MDTETKFEKIVRRERNMPVGCQQAAKIKSKRTQRSNQKQSWYGQQNSRIRKRRNRRST